MYPAALALVGAYGIQPQRPAALVHPAGVPQALQEPLDGLPDLETHDSPVMIGIHERKERGVAAQCVDGGADGDPARLVEVQGTGQVVGRLDPQMPRAPETAERHVSANTHALYLVIRSGRAKGRDAPQRRRGGMLSACCGRVNVWRLGRKTALANWAAG